VIVTGVEAPTAVVVTVNVALVAPAATMTLPGTVAAVLLLDSVTLAPVDGAALVSVAVPCDVLPPVTVVGLSAIADNVGCPGGGAAPALTVNDIAALSRSRPVIVTAVSEVTGDVAIGNVALAAPAGTVTFAGTVAALLDVNS
jgi:hypothetical protein